MADNNKKKKDKTIRRKSEVTIAESHLECREVRTIEDKSEEEEIKGGKNRKGGSDR